MKHFENFKKTTLYRLGIRFGAFALASLLSLAVYGQPCNLTVDAGSNVSICSGTTTQLNATTTGGVGTIKYSWTPVAGLSNANIANPIANPTVTTTYKVTVIDDNCLGADAKSGEIVVTVKSLPLIEFTFTNDNTCSGTAIQFTSFATGSGSLSYTWNFGDGITSTQQNPSHNFNSLGCSTSAFFVTLTVTDAAGCSASITHSVSVMQKPDIDFQDVNNPFDPFSNCSNASASNPVYPITIGNVSISTCISSFSIDWGDGTSANNVSFPISHSYSQLGAYNLVITAIGNNGCSSSKTYIIKNVSNPSGGIISPGSTTNLCAPTSNLQFELSKWGANSPGTIYEINYGDNSPIVTLTQEVLESSTYYYAINPIGSLNYPIPHSYTKSNCPESQFTVTLTVTNACGSTPFTAGNITVSTKSVANFTSPTSACVNSSVLFTNTTLTGFSQNCSRNSIYTWDFGDGTVETTLLGTAQNKNHFYSSPGNYTVSLTAQNFCGTTTKTQPICIEPTLVPQFTLSTNLGCVPLAVATTNTTNITKACNTPTYLWSVTFVNANCGIAQSPSFTGGTSNSSTNPSFLFTNPGIYTVSIRADTGSFPN